MLTVDFTAGRLYQKVFIDVIDMRWESGTISERAYFRAYIDAYIDEILTWNIDNPPILGPQFNIRNFNNYFC